VRFVDALPRNAGGKVLNHSCERWPRRIEMDIKLDDETLAFQAEVRKFLAVNQESIPTKSYDTAEGFAQHRIWDRVLFDADLSVITWPKKYGGRDAPLLHWVVFEEEYFGAGAPAGPAPTAPRCWLRRCLPRHREQLDGSCRKWLAANISGRKPGRSRNPGATWRHCGRLHQDGRRLVAQRPEIWSSRAPFAEMGFGLFRSDPAAERHNGLTYFMFDLKAKGITVRPSFNWGATPASVRSSSTTCSFPTRTSRYPKRGLARRDEHVEQ